MLNEFGSLFMILMIGSIPGQALLLLFVMLSHQQRLRDTEARLRKSGLLAGYVLTVLPLLYRAGQHVAYSGIFSFLTGAGGPAPIGQAPDAAALPLPADFELPAQANGWILLGAVIWLAGMMLNLYRSGRQMRAFRHQVMQEGRLSSVRELTLTSLRLPRPMVRQLKKLTIIRHPRACSPLVFGYVRHFLLLPDQAFTPDQLNMILRHELTHLHQKDLWIKLLADLCRSIFFFNPLMRVAGRHLDQACEQVCDLTVTRKLTKAQKKAYGYLLLSIIEQAKPAASLAHAALSQDKRQVLQRLRLIMHHRRASPARRVFQTSLSVLFIVCALSAMNVFSQQAIRLDADRQANANRIPARDTAAQGPAASPAASQTEATSFVREQFDAAGGVFDQTTVASTARVPGQRQNVPGRSIIETVAPAAVSPSTSIRTPAAIETNAGNTQSIPATTAAVDKTKERLAAAAAADKKAKEEAVAAAADRKAKEEAVADAADRKAKEEAVADAAVKVKEKAVADAAAKAKEEAVAAAAADRKAKEDAAADKTKSTATTSTAKLSKT